MTDPERDTTHPDVLLIYPPEDFQPGSFHRHFHHGIGGPPLGLIYLGSYLKAHGIQVQLYDARVDFDFDSIRTHDSSRPFRLGASDARIKEVLQSANPRIVGISHLYLSRLEQVLRVADLVKSALPDALVVMGGACCSALKEKVLEQCRCADVVVVGEGEEVLLHIVNRHLAGEDLSTVPSAAYRHNGTVCVQGPLPPAIVKDINSLPEPDYGLLDMDKYFRLAQMNMLSRLSWAGDELRRALPIITSRGCPYRCVFCQIPRHTTNKWRGERPHRVVERIAHLKHMYDATHFYFEDDAANIDERRFEQILDLIIERKCDVTWSAPNGIRAEGLTDRFVKKCIEAGCISLQVGIESGNQHVLNHIVHKNLDLEKAVAGIEHCSNNGLDVGAFFIIGFPGETKAQILNTVWLALKLNVLYSCRVHIYCAEASEGTTLFEMASAAGYVRKRKRLWSIQDVVMGRPTEREHKSVIETEAFGQRFLTSMQAMVTLVTTLTLVMRSVFYTVRHVQKRNNLALIVRCLRDPMALRRRYSIRNGWKRLLCRYLIFPQMIKKDT